MRSHSSSSNDSPVFDMMLTFEAMIALAFAFSIVLTMILTVSGIFVGVTVVGLHYGLKKVDAYYAQQRMVKALHDTCAACTYTALWTSALGLVSLAAIEVSSEWNTLTDRIADIKEAAVEAAVAAAAEAAPAAAVDAVRYRRTQPQSSTDTSARTGSL